MNSLCPKIVAKKNGSMDYFPKHPFRYERRLTREVFVGNVGIGGNNPIRIQSMLNTKTSDVIASVNQIAELKNAGCEIVRLTVPLQSDADALPDIRKEMVKRGIQIPLVADIHFSPSLAMSSVPYVEKIRINPGNFTDKNKMESVGGRELDYQNGLDRVRNSFIPLLKECKKHRAALRIGVNHGSLSERIMDRYGDTPLGMVESALEFIQIAESESFHEIIISMKSSNPHTMIDAYRLLVLKMDELNLTYPLHLGVTEAGFGKEGRMKSSAGIGSLLMDGIGDTIRVSLTEDPVLEIPTAKKLLYYVDQYKKVSGAGLTDHAILYNVAPDSRIKSLKTEVSLDCSIAGWEERFKYLIELSENRKNPNQFDTVHLSNLTSDIADKLLITLNQKENLNLSVDWSSIHLGLINLEKYRIHKVRIFEDSISQIDSIREKMPEVSIEIVLDGNSLTKPNFQEQIKKNQDKNTFVSLITESCLYEYRFLYAGKTESMKILLNLPVKNEEENIYGGTPMYATLLLEGIIDSIRIESGSTLDEFKKNAEYLFDLLHCTRIRSTRPEYISCPSCGRTQFDIQEVAGKIKEATSHLPNIKIAVMGCIVNGPGELSDSDFGYVGAGPGKIHLYKKKEAIEKNIPQSEALIKLIDVLKINGCWKDPTLD